jgi:hypothetical protein
MIYKTKVYVGFDGDKDIHYYRLLIAWAKNKNLDFSLNDAHDINSARDTSTEETIKRRLRERLNGSKAFILLVGESTKYLYKFVKWEMETALKLGLPIIVVNINKKRSRDDLRCPAAIRDQLAVHVSFEMKIISYAVNNWPSNHKRYIANGDIGSYYYYNSQYTKLGL